MRGRIPWRCSSRMATHGSVGVGPVGPSTALCRPPAAPIDSVPLVRGALAQLVERDTGSVEVRGSIPLRSTIHNRSNCLSFCHTPSLWYDYEPHSVRPADESGRYYVHDVQLHGSETLSWTDRLLRRLQPDTAMRSTLCQWITLASAVHHYAWMRPRTARQGACGGRGTTCWPGRAGSQSSTPLRSMRSATARP